MPDNHSHPHDHGKHDSHDHDSHGHDPHNHEPHHHGSHEHESGLPHVHHASYGKLLVGFWIIASFMLVEIVCGWLFNSLTLLSDGFHMLSDALALGLSAYAVALGSRKATEKKTFGFKRMEVLAAFANGLTLLILSIFVFIQAIERLWHPLEVDSQPMLWVASLGLVVNLATAWWLHRGSHEKTMNEESAFFHVLGDLGASLAAIIAALLIMFRGWNWADPVLSLVIVGPLAWAGIRVMRHSGNILVEGIPKGIAIDTVRAAILRVEQVQNVHDLHIWSMNGRDLYLSAHVEILAGSATEKAVTATLTKTLREKFQMDHITLQVGLCADDDCYNNCEDMA